MKITKRQLRRIIREAVGESDARKTAQEVMDYYESIKDEDIYKYGRLALWDLQRMWGEHTGRTYEEVLAMDLFDLLRELNDGEHYLFKPGTQEKMDAVPSMPSEPEEETIINADDLYNMIMDTEQPSQAWQDGVRRVGDFREYISGMVDAARRGGMSKKDINRITSLAWKTETSERRRGRRQRSYSFLD